jgi:hypothetical protein
MEDNQQGAEDTQSTANFTSECESFFQEYRGQNSADGESEGEVYDITTLSAPSGVTSMAGAKE